MIRPETLTDVVWLQTSFLGDVILSTAAMGLLRQEMPTLRQHLITTPLGADALADYAGLDSLIVFDKRGHSLFRLASKIRNELVARGINAESAIVLQPHRSPRSSFLRVALGLPSITYEETVLSSFADLTVSRVALFHEAHRIGMLLEGLGVSRSAILNSKPQLTATQFAGDKGWQRELVDFSGRLIAIAPGSVWGTKRWPVEHYRSILSSIVAGYPEVGIVVLGSRAEAGICRDLVEGFNFQRRLWNLAGLTSLRDLTSLFPLLRLLIANDSSPIHYASAFSVPTVAIFGATVSAMGFGPLAPRSHILELGELGCRPCSDHGPQICPLGHFRCMRELTPIKILRAIEEAMAN